jgi:carboxymethylenebutenolidase
MTANSSIVEIPIAGEGRCATHVIRPPAATSPAVVLLPPIFGTTPGIKQFAQSISDHGFYVAVPDMFWRTLPGPLGYEGSDRDKAQERYKNFDVKKGVDDLAHIVDWCRGADFGTGKVGVVGLCFGGRYAVVAAAKLGIGAAVSYHGTFIGTHLDILPTVDCPLSLHFGEEDPHAPMSEVARIAQACRGNSNIELFTYAKIGHGFMQQDRPSYGPKAAELAFARGIATLKSGLAGS